MIGQWAGPRSAVPHDRTQSATVGHRSHADFAPASVSHVRTPSRFSGTSRQLAHARDEELAHPSGSVTS
jgi:hypothetical protein